MDPDSLAAIFISSISESFPDIAAQITAEINRERYDGDSDGALRFVIEQIEARVILPASIQTELPVLAGYLGVGRMRWENSDVEPEMGPVEMARIRGVVAGIAQILEDVHRTLGLEDPDPPAEFDLPRPGGGGGPGM